MRLLFLTTLLCGLAVGIPARGAEDTGDLKAMVGQMLMVEFALDANRYVTDKGGHPHEAIEDMLRLVEAYHVGGFVNEGGNDAVYLDRDFAQVRQAETPLGLAPIVAVNEEGGEVQFPSDRWWDHEAEWIGCTSLGIIVNYNSGARPPETDWACPDHPWSADHRYLPFLRNAHLMAEQWTTEETASHAAGIGRALADLNITMTLAPVLGVSDGTPASSFLADRTFSDDPETVAAWARAFSEGIVGGSEGRATTVVKHFPGLGDVRANTDDGPAHTAPLATLKSRDLVPYEKPIAGYYGAAAVMMSNAIVPGLTCPTADTTCTVPATLSAAAYQLLRGDYGWDGLIMTDTLQTKAVLTPERGMPQAVVAAIAAGADLVLVKPDAEQPSLSDHEQLLGEVQKAVLAWIAEDPGPRVARVQESVKRIRAVKAAIAAAWVESK